VGREHRGVEGFLSQLNRGFGIGSVVEELDLPIERLCHTPVVFEPRGGPGGAPIVRLRAGGIAFATPARESEPPTARCSIFVTPDGQRTMNTFLGASQFSPAEASDETVIADAAVLYLEGYSWDPEEPRKAMRRAIAAARTAGRKVAFTSSDAFVIARHGDDFRASIEAGQIDILFAN
ncbi:hypothetical protein OY671_010385, partial [Metschnikowia pulcherrima]